MDVTRGRVAQNVAALLGGRAASLLISAASAVILTRALGPDAYGVYSSVFAFLALFGWLASLGLEALLPRVVAQHRALLPSLLFTATLLSAATSLLATAVASGIGFLLGYRGEIFVVLLLGAFDVLLLAPGRLAGAVHQADLRQWLPVSIGIVRQLFWLVALVALAAFRAGLFWVLAARALAGVLEVSLLFKARYHGEAFPPARAVRPFGLALAAAPLALNSFAVAIYHRADQTILFRLQGSEVVGHYALATNTVELLNALPNAVMASLFPLLVSAQRNSNQLRSHLGSAFRLLNTAVLLACVVVAAAGPELVSLVYGPGYAPAAPLLRILIWSEVAVCTGTIMSGALLALSLQAYLPASTLIGAVLNVGGNLLLIPRFGPVAAAWVTVCSYTLAGFVMFLFMRSTRELAWLAAAATAAPLASALVIATLAALLPFGPILRAGISAATLTAFLCVIDRAFRRDVTRVMGMFARPRGASHPPA